MPVSYGKWIKQGVAVFFEYDTPKIVHIKSKKIGILSRLVQLAIIAYVIGYVLYYNKAYQEFDNVVSAVSAKVKGIVETKFSDKELANVPEGWKHLYRRIWDVADFVVPPTQNNAFFVTTNMIITPNQTMSECSETPDDDGGEECEHDMDCPAGEVGVMGHGINTGRCVPWQWANDSSLPHKFNFTCQIKGWCPVEIGDPMDNKAVLEDSKHLSVLIKNQIEFPKFGKKRTNILATQNKTYLKNCHYNEDTDPFCPIFTLDTIVTLAGENYSEMSVSGGVISLGIYWDCDLDHEFLTHCRPEYNFRRLDHPSAKIAPGYNFRHANFFGDDRRTLYKVYGINFVVNVWGRAGKFSVIPTLMNLGAGLALLSITTVICDIIVLYFLKNGEFYKDKKYLNINGEDAYKPFENPNYNFEDNSNRGGSNDIDSVE